MLKGYFIDSEEKYDFVMKAIEEISDISWSSGTKLTDTELQTKVEFLTVVKFGENDYDLDILELDELVGLKLKSLTLYEFLRWCAEKCPKVINSA